MKKETIGRELLVIAHSFPPSTTPCANRSSKLLANLQEEWLPVVVTGTPSAKMREMEVFTVPSRIEKYLFGLASKLKLEKLWYLLVWPDNNIFWVIPAIIKSYKIYKQRELQAIAIFVMPYSASLVGIILKWLTGLPLLINLGDSPTCSDMHSVYPTRIHYWMYMWFEDFLVSQCDAIIYVSQNTIDRVKSRQPVSYHSKFYLSRGGIDFRDFSKQQASLDSTKFSIVYTGGMNGWYEFYKSSLNQYGLKFFLKKIYQKWLRFGQHRLTDIDYRSSSPIFVGKAVKSLLESKASWAKKVNISIYGNQYPDEVVSSVLEEEGISEFVSVYGRVEHHKAIQISANADLLFLTLPGRPDQSISCRISLKTYEYLMTDRPILAAVPKGENWDYLQDKPGVWLVEPTDIKSMNEIICSLVEKKFEGHSLKFDRSYLRDELSYAKKADEFSRLLLQTSTRSVFSPDDD